MKKVLIAAALVATGATAQAADLPVKAAPYYKAPAAKVYDWTGFYLGVNAGVGFGRSYTQLGDFAGGNASSRLGGMGALGGAQIGYNWQYGNFAGLGNVVFGLEADIQGSGLNDDRTCEYGCGAGNGFAVNQKLDWFGTVRGRVGLATGPVLSYFTGGLAYGGVNTTITDQSAPAGATSFSNTKTGWTLGSGVEAALGGNWTGKIEYLYVSLGTQTGANTAAVNPYLFRSEVYEHVFRAGLNYRIGEHALYVAEPVARWAGFYGGVDVGGAAAINRSSLTYPVIFVGTLTDKFNLSSTNGFTGGGQIGYNFQSANWVFGIETDIQGSTQRDNKACEIGCFATAFNAAFDQKLDWLGTTRGRVGYSLGSTLFYFTGGAAYGDVKTNVAGVNFLFPFNQTFTHTKAGYTVGGGIESPFNLFGLFGPNWTAKTEYLYVDLGRTSDFIPLTATAGMTFSTHVQEHLFRSGLNYHFNEPVAAKY